MAEPKVSGAAPGPSGADTAGRDEDSYEDVPVEDTRAASCSVACFFFFSILCSKCFFLNQELQFFVSFFFTKSLEARRLAAHDWKSDLTGSDFQS